eukprot:5344915-Prymnesium_polylepis.1
MSASASSSVVSARMAASSAATLPSVTCINAQARLTGSEVPAQASQANRRTGACINGAARVGSVCVCVHAH